MDSSSFPFYEKVKSGRVKICPATVIPANLRQHCFKFFPSVSVLIPSCCAFVSLLPAFSPTNQIIGLFRYRTCRFCPQLHQLHLDAVTGGSPVCRLPLRSCRRRDSLYLYSYQNSPFQIQFFQAAATSFSSLLIRIPCVNVIVHRLAEIR